MSGYRNLLIIMLALAVVASGILILIVNFNSPINGYKSSAPNAFMTGVVATKMNKNGKPKSTLYSPKLLHYYNGNQSYLEKPHITFYNQHPQSSRWDVYSNHAQTVSKTRNIILSGNVRAIRAASQNNPKTTFVTSQITVYPNDEVAISDKNVKIIQKGSVVNSKGIKAYLKTGLIKLLSHARGEFNPDED